MKALHLGGLTKHNISAVYVRRVSRADSTLCRAVIYISFVRIRTAEKIDNDINSYGAIAKVGIKCGNAIGIISASEITACYRQIIRSI